MKPHKGFSLLEILIAFAIMAVAITIVLRIFGSGVNSAVVSEDYSLAVQIAESLMARTGIETPLETGEISGNAADKYDWRVTIKAVAHGGASNDQTRKNEGPILFSVNVRVAWGDDDSSQRAIELYSLKTF